jgi:hypothetical protein
MKRHLHTRRVQVEAYEVGEDRILLEGYLRDEGHVRRYHHLGQEVPPGTVHHMALELVVEGPEGRIAAVHAHMPKGAVPTCEGITPNYDALVGLELGRGFQKKLLERVGGPLGCTHLTTLVLEMQRTHLQTRATRPHRSFLPEAPLSPQAIATYRPPNFEVCHQYAEGGQYIRDIREHLREREGAGG